MNITQAATNLSRFEQDFDALLQQQRFDEAERLLAECTEIAPQSERKAPFSIPLRLRGDPGRGFADAGPVLPAVNGFSRKLRNARYRAKIRNGYRGVRIVEEGDSWTQYPIALQDIADWVAREYAVYSLGAPGDTVDGIVLDGEFERAIGDEQPDAFLLSAGGNDLLGGGRLGSILLDHIHGARPEDLIDADAFDPILTRILRQFRAIVERALSLKPDLKIFIHGYDYARPVAGGRWLGRPLAARHIPMDLGRDVIKGVVDRFNAEIAKFAADFPRTVYHIDVRGRVGPHANSWRDELHPENAGFQRIATPFIAEIGKIAEIRRVPGGLAPVEATVASRMSRKDLYAALLRARADDPRAAALRNLRAKSCQDSEVELARKDIEMLAYVLDEPESRERVEARQQYSLYSGPGLCERIVERRNPDEYFVLSRGVEAGRAVARLLVRQPDGGTVYGTGFLVGPNLLLTSNHLIPDRTMAANTVASFNNELDTDGSARTAVDFRTTPTPLVTSQRLDYTLVGVEPLSRDGRALAEFGHIALLPRSGKALKKEFVNIIQHPGGRHKKVAIRENLVIGRARDFLYYVTDTEPGSSGAPVMNDEWQIAALHQMAVPDRNNPDDFIANRGVRVSSILDDVARKCNSGDADATDADRRLQVGRSSYPALLDLTF